MLHQLPVQHFWFAFKINKNLLNNSENPNLYLPRGFVDNCTITFTKNPNLGHFGMYVVAGVAQLGDLLGQQLHPLGRVAEDDALHTTTSGSIGETTIQI